MNILNKKFPWPGMEPGSCPDAEIKVQCDFLNSLSFEVEHSVTRCWKKVTQTVNKIGFS